MKTSKNGLDLIKHYEGCRLTAYPDPATHAEPWTIGIGHTGLVDGVKVHKGMVITQQKADIILQSDLVRFEKSVTTLVKVPLTQGQFDSLVSFCFNLGSGALQQSTLLKLLNKKKYKEASLEFIKWNKAGGKVMAGLTKRRNAESYLFKNNIFKVF